MPHKVCPNCGTHVSHKADTCFMCGYRFDAPRRRIRIRIPWADIALVVVLVGLVLLWWRWDEARRVLALTPSPTPTLTPTPTITPTPSPTPTITPTPTLTPTPTPIIYTVKPGDTYYGIAGRFGIDLDALLAANPGVSTTSLQPGQTLIIPSGEAVLEPLPTPEPLTGRINYPVEPGDTVEAIAIRFHVDQTAILENNDIADPNKLQVGQVLIIPVGTTTPTPDLGPTPTPTPQLISPPDGVVYVGQPGPLLRWVADRILPEDVWYQVGLAYADPHLQNPDPILTKASSYRLDESLRPPPGAVSPEIRWWVRLVRVLPDGEIVPVSPPSPVRSLEWR